MILKYIAVRNFRQFAGEQRMVFAPPGQQNVTVIYGANGSGKTTLLNAFTWALFDRFTPAFENQVALLNEMVRSEITPGGSAEVSVEVGFEHDNRDYHVVRTQSTFRDASGAYRDGGSSRTLDIQNAENKMERSAEAADVIGQILPTGLHQFFFFDGERIERLVNPDEASQDLDQAIKTILGLEVLERVHASMPDAKKKLRDALKQFETGAANDLILIIDRENKEISELREAIGQHKKNRSAKLKDKEEVEALLRDNAVARERQLRLDDLVKQESSIVEKLSQSRRDTRLALSDRAFLAFSENLAQSAIASVEDLREKGRLPAAYERQFLEDLLARDECLCGTALTEGSAPRATVTSLLPAGGIRDLQESWNRISADAKRYLGDRDSVRERLTSNVDAIVKAESELDKVRQEIYSVREQQKKSGVGVVTDYAEQREIIEKRIRELDLLIHTAENDLSVKEKNLEDLDSKLIKAKTGSEKAEALQRQLASADRISEAVARILQIRRDNTREQLDERIKQTYGQIAFKAYIPELTSDFRLRLTKKVGSLEDVAVSKSQGENQLLALSFVGALAKLARERFEQRETANKESLSNFEGGVFPLVMDSPFGALDENYRREVAHAIPLLAPQVVAMVSKSQGLGVVQEQLYGRIGKSWVITVATPKGNADAEFLEVAGKSVPYIVRADGEFETASFQEIS